MNKIDAKQIVFLKDSPQPLSERDELSHQSLADRIVQAVQTCPTPYTIGLSGEWGSGKTSVAKHVERALGGDSSKPEKLPVVYFDAWKYQQDSLRRQFLIEAHHQLCDSHYLDNGDLTPAELYQTQSFTHSPEVDWKAVVPWRSKQPLAAWFRVIVFLLGVGAIAFALLSASSVATRLVTALLGGTGVTAFLNLLPRLLVTGVPTDVKPPLSSAEEFGKKFTDWLNKDKLKKRRLLVIVDNLDRCDDSHVLDLLGDIKTFLEPEGAEVVFLLPVDEGAVRRVLTNRYGTSDAANEFLRKFFNTLFRIPVPLAGETRAFAGLKLRESGLVAASSASDEELGRVITVMTAAYPNNPRRVIQFLNRLTAQWLLLASTAEQLRKPELAADLASIAKGVAIRERWPDVASFLESSPLELARAQDAAVAGNNGFKLTLLGLQPVDPPEDELPGLAGFLRATQFIPLVRPRLILTAKADRFEVELPDAELLRAFLRGDQQDLKAVLVESAWTEALEAGNVSDFIIQELADLSSAQQFEGVGILISAVGPTLEVFPALYRSRLADQMGSEMNRQPVLEAIAKLAPGASIPVAQATSGTSRRSYDAIAQILSLADPTKQTDFARELARHATALESIKGQLLAQVPVRTDPNLLEALLFAEDDKPGAFWDTDVVLACCRQVISSTESAVLDPGLPATRRLLEASAKAGNDVAADVVDLLENQASPEQEQTFKWAARSNVLTSVAPTESEPLEALRVRAEQVRDGGGIFTRIDYMALIARLYGQADAASKSQFDSEISAWLSSAQIDPGHELGGWFPPLIMLGLDLGNLLFEVGPTSLDQTEAQARIAFAVQQVVTWKQIADSIASLMGSTASQPKALVLTREAITQNAETVPEDFNVGVWPALLTRLYERGIYTNDALDLLSRFASTDGPIDGQGFKRALRNKLIDAMADGHTAAAADYQGLNLSTVESDQDAETTLDKIRTKDLSLLSGLLLDTTLMNPTRGLRSDIIKELEILATDSTYWSLGLQALGKVDWPPGVQIAARVSETLARDSLLQRESEPKRSVHALKTAIHMAELAKERAPRAELDTTISALSNSSLITEDEAQTYKAKLA